MATPQKTKRGNKKKSKKRDDKKNRNRREPQSITELFGY